MSNVENPGLKLVAEATFVDHHYGDVSWVGGAGPKNAVGKCDHLCRHQKQQLVAVVPTPALSRLKECDQCRCRAWFAAAPLDALPPTWRKVA